MNIVNAWGYYNLAKVVVSKSEKKETSNEEEQKKTIYRPPEWSGLPSELSQLVLVKTNIAGFFFDAVIREEHTSTLKITSHPVQTGANITDHAYIEPATLTMEIAMSDGMDSLIPNQFSGKYTKSVSAYQTLLDLQESRIPVSINTRIRRYDNMLIEELVVPNDYKTLYGLRCTVTLREIFIVNVSKTTVSSRPQVTGQTDRGNVQAVEDPGTGISQGEKILGL